MALTPTQRSTLEQYRAWSEQAPTIPRLVRQRWGAHVGSLLPLLLFFAFFLVQGEHVSASLMGGIALGILARDLNTYYRLKLAWPATRDVIAWDEVERLLAGDGEKP